MLIVILKMLAVTAPAAALLYMVFRKKTEFMSRQSTAPVIMLFCFTAVTSASLILADMGCWSLKGWVPAGTIIGILSLLLIYVCRKGNINVSVPAGRSMLLFVLILTAFLTVIMRPYQYMRGGWDPGEYISTALHIERTGSLGETDALFASLPDDVQEVLMHRGDRKAHVHAGYVLDDREIGAVTPDYFHLYPSWLALFAKGSKHLSVYYGHTVLALISISFVFLAVLSIFGIRSALLCVLLLAVSPAQIYFSRFTASELLMQALLFGGLLCYSEGFKKRTIVFDILGGFAFGAAFLCHSTSAPFIAAAFLFLCVHALYRRSVVDLRKPVILVLFTVIAVARNVLNAGTMMSFFVSFGKKLMPLMLPLAVAGGVVLLFAFVLTLLMRKSPDKFDNNYLLRWIPGALILIIGLLLYFVRPQMSNDQEARNMVLIGCLVTPVILILTASFFFRRKWSEWTPGQWFFLFAAGATSVLLIRHRMIHPLLMWAVRRYIAVVLPLFFVTASVGLTGLLFSGRRYIRAAGGSLLILTYGALLYRSYPVISVRENSGLPAFLLRVAEHIEDPDLVLCDHCKYSTPLHYGFGLPAYQFERQPEECGIAEAGVISGWLKRSVQEGMKIYYVTVTRSPSYPGLFFEERGYEENNVQLLRRQKLTLPRETADESDRAYVYEVVPYIGQKLPLAVHSVKMGYHSMGMLRGFHSMQRRGDMSYRWTDGKAAVYLPGYHDVYSSVTVRLTPGSSRPGDDPVAAVFKVNGAIVKEAQLEREWVDVRFVMPPLRAGENVQLLEIQSGTWNPLEAGLKGYPEMLGVAIERITVMPCDDIGDKTD